MRVLITGHCGFIGRNLTQELQDAGYELIGHDRDDGDLTRPGVFIHALQRHKPDQVIHLAAQVGRLFGEDDLEYTIRENAIMTTFVAHACGERGIPLMYASTSEVYGDRGGYTCQEGAPLTPWTPQPLPHNLYGLSKRWGEEACRLYAPDGLRIVRLSMPYGPWAPPGRGRRALDTFLWLAHHRRPLTVHRGAERCWCWVGDTVRGMRLVLERGMEVEYNIGRDDRRTTMLQLAEMCCDLVGAPRSLIREVDPPARQTVIKRLSTDRLRALGWEPSLELEDGLPRVLEWVKRFPPPALEDAAVA